jgi:hypothetical protein
MTMSIKKNPPPLPPFEAKEYSKLILPKEKPRPVYINKGSIPALIQTDKWMFQDFVEEQVEIYRLNHKPTSRD